MLRAPFPWFGGKSRAAHLVWQAFGDVPNYVEPFAGSLAVLLRRPTAPRVETVNDLDCYVANFWRAVKWAPDEVAAHADWPVNEADLHARHRWLVAQEEFRHRMRHEPEYFDAKIAGWWVWGICQWIGAGWCRVDDERGRDQLANGKMPDVSSGRGVHARGKSLGAIYDWMHALCARLRRVRVCCGDWQRVLGPSVTEKIGVTGIFLDPPYSAAANRDPRVYSHDDLEVAHRVREWALANGSNPKLRIALCGYEGEHEMPADWHVVEWKAVGGYAAAAGNHENARKERIWFSPHCEPVRRQLSLFEEAA